MDGWMDGERMVCEREGTREIKRTGRDGRETWAGKEKRI